MYEQSETIERDESQPGFVPLSDTATEGGFIPIEEIKAKERRIREALPETLSFAGLDTGIPMTPALSSYLVNLGAGMTGSYRGAKQLLGLDKTRDDKKLTDFVTGKKVTPAVSAEAINEAFLSDLSRDPEVGGYATAGRFVGFGFDPAAYVMPFKRAKSVIDLAKQGFVAGGIFGALHPIEEGGSRTVNAATGAVATATFMPAVGSVAVRLAGGKWLPLLTPAEAKSAVGKAAQEAAGATQAAGKAPEASPVESTPTRQAEPFAQMQQEAAVTTETAGIGPSREGFVPLKEAGFADVQLTSRISGSTAGAATGALTADEDASPAEIASRALLGGAAGWQIAKIGGMTIARRTAAKEAGEAITAIPTVKAPRDTPDVTVVGDAAEPLLTKEMSQPLIKKLTDLAKAHFAENPNSRNPNILISDDVAAKIVTGEIAPEVAAKYGISKTELATAMRSSVSNFARGMARFSHVYRELRASMTPEERAVIDAAGDASSETYVRPLWKKITDTWRALLVTQPATAVRNYVTQLGRVGLDTIQAPIDNWLQNLTGRKVTTHPLDGIEEILSVFQRNKKNVDKIFEAFPNQRDRMLQNYLSDVANTDAIPTEAKIWRRIGSAVNMANILNRTQEFIVRRAIFQTSLAQQLRKEGKDLTQIIESNQIDSISEDVIKTAVDQSLIKTFAETPAWGTMSRKLIDAVNAVPGANLAIPFPRFMYNAIKFQYQYSPLGILSYLSSAERMAFAAGDTSKISKAIIGTGFLGAAFGMRNSDHAGEKWYEYVNDNGEVVDLRPFNPFASYLFIAEVLKRQKDGTLYKLSGSDIAQGLLSTNMRAGTGLYLLDNAIGLMSKSADDKKLATKTGELTGDFLAGFFTPLNVLRDAYDQFTEGQSIQRDTRGESFLGPIKSRIPIVSQTLPETESPMREGPNITVNPLLRQVTGLSVHDPKNALEKELDRLGFERREVLPSTGDHELDVKYAKAMGAVSERILVPLVESDKFQNMPDAVKGVILSEALSELRNEVRKAVNKTLPAEKQLEMEIRKQPPRLRFLLKDFGVSP